jgi:tetraacyldisaccharide-1-P 4'-kinase
MEQFATATADRDYATICKQVLAPDLIAHLAATGVTCEQAWQLALSGVKNPYISVGKITVTGSSATAIVLSVASNQRSSLNAVGLVKTGSGWRVESLANQLPGG